MLKINSRTVFGPQPLTLPLQLVAVGDEFQRIRLIRRVDVVHVDVQVVRRVQEVVRQQRALAVVQGQVHLRRHQGAALMVGRHEAEAPSSSSCGGTWRSCSSTGREEVRPGT